MQRQPRSWWPTATACCGPRTTCPCWRRRDRVTLVLALLDDPEDVEILDDGCFTTVKVRNVDLSDERIAQIELIGGDLRVRGRSDDLRLELRLYRDGRPESVGRACSSWADWPDDQQEFAVDLSFPRVPAPG